MNEIEMTDEENEEQKGSLYTLEREFEASTETTGHPVSHDKLTRKVTQHLEQWAISNTALHH